MRFCIWCLGELVSVIVDLVSVLRTVSRDGFRPHEHSHNVPVFDPAFLLVINQNLPRICAIRHHFVKAQFAINHQSLLVVWQNLQVAPTLLIVFDCDRLFDLLLELKSRLTITIYFVIRLLSIVLYWLNSLVRQSLSIEKVGNFVQQFWVYLLSLYHAWVSRKVDRLEGNGFTGRSD
jgi:hypothetical protein